MLIALSLLFHHWLGSIWFCTICMPVCMYKLCLYVFCSLFSFRLSSLVVDACCSYCQQLLLFLVFFMLYVSLLIHFGLCSFCFVWLHANNTRTVQSHSSSITFVWLFFDCSSVCCAWICEYSYVFYINTSRVLFLSRTVCVRVLFITLSISIKF